MRVALLLLLAIEVVSAVMYFTLDSSLGELDRYIGFVFAIGAALTAAELYRRRKQVTLERD